MKGKNVLLRIFVLFSIIFLTIFYIIGHSFFLSLFLGVDNLGEIFLTMSLMYTIYIICADFILLFYFEIKRNDFDRSFVKIFNKLRYMKKDEKMKIFFSSSSPLFLSLKGFGKNYFIINENLWTLLDEKELIAYMDCEITYASTFTGRIELLVKKLYFVSVYPAKTIFNKFFGNMITFFLITIFCEIYKYIIYSCRQSSNYTGNFKKILYQIILKMKIYSKEFGKIKEFNYSQECLALMLKKKKGKIIDEYNIEQIF